jgi:hypothetical protein
MGTPSPLFTVPAAAVGTRHAGQSRLVAFITVGTDKALELASLLFVTFSFPSHVQ